MTRVLRVSHSSVMGAWRERDRELRRLGAEIALVCASRWQEGTAEVQFDAELDDFVLAARTVGHHPNLFLFDPRPIWRLLSSGIDLIDLQEEPFSLVAAEVLLLRLARRINAPFVIYSAQNLDKRYPPPFGWIERWVLATAGGAYVCNAEAGARLRRRGFKGALTVLPLGVDIERFRPASRVAPQGSLRIGFVGRFAHQKGIHVLLEALQHLDCCTLELVGGGPENEILALQADKLGLGERVSFAGHVPQDELPARYRRYDVVVVPSLPTAGWTEQFCRVAVEAMASGVPVIASDAGALPEVVGDAGILVPPGDVALLRAALTSLLSDPARWSAMRERGLARAAGYRWSVVASSHLELYKRVAP